MTKNASIRNVSYENFKRVMDLSLRDSSWKSSGSKEASSVANNIELLDVCLIALAGICDIAVSYTNTLSTIVLASGKEEGRRKYGLTERFGEDGKARQMANRLKNLIGKYNKGMDRIAALINSDDTTMTLCENFDYVADSLSEIVYAYGRYIFGKVCKTTLSTPKDPKILSDFIMSLVFVDIAHTTYENLSDNFSYLKNIKEYDFLCLDRISEQIVKLMRYLPFHDTKDRPLTYNVDGILRSEESKEMISDIYNILYSTELLGNISLRSSKGKVNILSRFEDKSIIEKYNAHTLSIEEFKQKYNNKYKN